MARYFDPAYTILRLEAIWHLRVAHSRSVGPIVKKLLKRLTVGPKQDFAATVGSKPGHLLELFHVEVCQALDNDSFSTYPDW